MVHILFSFSAHRAFTSQLEAPPFSMLHCKNFTPPNFPREKTDLGRHQRIPYQFVRGFFILHSFQQIDVSLESVAPNRVSFPKELVFFIPKSSLVVDQIQNHLDFSQLPIIERSAKRRGPNTIPSRAIPQVNYVCPFSISQQEQIWKGNAKGVLLTPSVLP